MEEKKLSEQESLELISQMIRSTRKNMEVGSGNQFLYWGYFTAALSVLLFYWCTILAMPVGVSAGSACFCSGALCFVCSERKLLR